MNGGSDQRDGDTPLTPSKLGVTSAGLPEQLPLLEVAGRTLFPHTVVPFHVFDHSALSVVDESLTGRRLLVVVASAGVGGAQPDIGVVGRIVSDRRAGDGRTEVFVHGMERAALTRLSPGRVEVLPVVDTVLVDEVTLAEVSGRVVELATNLARTSGPRAAELGRIIGASAGPGVLSDRLAHVLVDDLELRQALLEATCPAERCAALEHVLLDELLAAAPADGGWVN